MAGKVAVGEVSPSLLTFSRWGFLMVILPMVYARQMRVAWPVLQTKWMYIIAMGALGLAASICSSLRRTATTAVNIGILQGAIPDRGG